MPVAQETRSSGTINVGFVTGSNRFGHGQNTVGTQGPLHFVFGIGNLGVFSEIRTTSPDAFSTVQEIRTAVALGIVGAALFGQLLFGLGAFSNQADVGNTPSSSKEVRTSGTV